MVLRAPSRYRPTTTVAASCAVRRRTSVPLLALLAVACAPEPELPSTLSTVRLDGQWQVESAAQGVDAIRAQRLAILAAGRRYAEAHPAETVIHSFTAAPFVTVRAPPVGERLHPLPIVELKPRAEGTFVVLVDDGFDTAAIGDGACFTDRGCAGGPVAADARLDRVSAGCEDCRHGRDVAAAAAETGPGIGVLGIKAWADGKSMRLVDLLRALEHVHLRWQHEFSVAAVNLSLRFESPADGSRLYADPAACAAAHPSTAWMVQQLRADGIAVVAAAGDEGADGKLSAPACLPGVISVAAIGAPGSLAPRANSASFLSLAAPGHRHGESPSDTDASAMAAARVTGWLGRARAAEPELTLPALEARLFENATVISTRSGAVRVLANEASLGEGLVPRRP